MKKISESSKKDKNSSLSINPNMRKNPITLVMKAMTNKKN